MNETLRAAAWLLGAVVGYVGLKYYMEQRRAEYDEGIARANSETPRRKVHIPVDEDEEDE